MNIQKISLKKRVSDDGLAEMNENVPIGKVYNIDIDSEWIGIFKHSSGKIHTKRIVNTDKGEWMFAELLGL